MLQLYTPEEKTNIIRNKSKLKDVADRIFINENLTQKAKEKQRIIREMENTDRSKGKRVNIKYIHIIRKQWTGKNRDGTKAKEKCSFSTFLWHTNRASHGK